MSIDLTPPLNPDDDPRIRRAREGDRAALAELLAEEAAGLRRYLERRIDPRLRGRVAASDLLQDVYLAAERRLDHFRERPGMTFRLWARLLAGQRLADAHRYHLGAQVRNAGREVSADAPTPPNAGTGGVDDALVNRLAADWTSPSAVMARDEVRSRVALALASLGPLDRQVLTLRHIDQLTNVEVARALDIPEGTASRRYVRALARLRAVLEPDEPIDDRSGA